MSDYGQSTANVKVERSLSRIDNDVEMIKRLVERTESTTQRIIRHARSMGYFELPKDSGQTAPTPVVTTLADALQALDRAIDHCSGALNVFD
jgi:hypothetical protein